MERTRCYRARGPWVCPIALRNPPFLQSTSQLSRTTLIFGPHPSPPLPPSISWKPVEASSISPPPVRCTPPGTSVLRDSSYANFVSEKRNASSRVQKLLLELTLAFFRHFSTARILLKTWLTSFASLAEFQTWLIVVSHWMFLCNACDTFVKSFYKCLDNFSEQLYARCELWFARFYTEEYENNLWQGEGVNVYFVHI